MPVFIFQRSDEQIKRLKQKEVLFDPKHRYEGIRQFARTHGNKLASQLMDSSKKYNEGKFRSEDPRYAVFLTISPSTSCAIYPYDGYFHDACGGLKFDMSGRQLQGQLDEDFSLFVPPHKIENGLIIFGEFEYTGEIVDFSPNILELDISNYEKAVEAIMWNKLAVLKWLIVKEPLLLEKLNENGSSLIHLGVRFPRILAFLLKNGSDPNVVNNSGFTPLMLTIMISNYDGVEILLNNGAKLDEISDGGNHSSSIYDFLISDRQWYKSRAIEFIRELESLVAKHKAN